MPELEGLAELSELGLTIEIEPLKAARIWAAMQSVYARLLRGDYRKTFDETGVEHFTDVYDAIAAEVVNADTTDEVLESVIPSVVYAFTVRKNWSPYMDLKTMKEWPLHGPIIEWKAKRLAILVSSVSAIDAPNIPIADRSHRGYKRAAQPPLAATGEPAEPPIYPRRAAWLRVRLRERAWNRNDPLRQRGPDPKTIDKILAGSAVRVDVLEKLANALSTKRATVDLLEIPQD